MTATQENQKVKLPQLINEIETVWHLFGVRVENRDEFIKYLSDNGIQALILLNKKIYDKKILKKEFNKVMLVSTGALLSPTSTLQKQTIPCVAHAVVIEND